MLSFLNKNTGGVLNPKQVVRRFSEALIRDDSSTSIFRDYKTCVYCDACVDACEKQGFNVYDYSDPDEKIPPMTIDNVPMAQSGCVGCGQCTLICPKACLTEAKHIDKVRELLKNKGDKILVASIAPAVRAGVAEALGLEVTPNVTEQIFGALKSLGFDYVFDISFSADVTIIEEAAELVSRVTEPKESSPLPMFTSCCPAWVNSVEKHFPQLIPHLSTTRSPQGIFGSCIKNIWAKEKGIDKEKICNITVMPCTAKKSEAARPQLNNETDYVLTTREFIELVAAELGDKQKIMEVPASKPDPILGDYSGAGIIFGSSGGVMEAALRTTHKLLTGKDSDALLECKAIRGVKNDQQMKEGTFNIAGKDINVLVVHGGAALHEVAEGVIAKDPKFMKYHFIEVMTCPGGCVNGGGQPLVRGSREAAIVKRATGLYNLDGHLPTRRSHDNRDAQEMYRKYLGKPNGHEAHELFHTHYGI